MQTVRTFTFNRPWTVVFLLPLVLLMVMFFAGLLNEFSFFVLLMILVTSSVMLLVLYLSLLRRIKIGEGIVVWKTPFVSREYSLSEIKTFGIVKFRRFRFIYLSKLETPPFGKSETPAVTTEDTVVLQFRQSAWTHVLAAMEIAKPGLKPQSFS